MVSPVISVYVPRGVEWVVTVSDFSRIDFYFEFLHFLSILIPRGECRMLGKPSHTGVR